MRTAIIGILVLAAIGLIAYLIFGVNKAAAAPVDPTTKGRPTPQPSWTQADWLANGYTQQEIDAASTASTILNDVNPFA